MKHARPVTMREANAAELRHIPDRIAAAQLAGDENEKARLELRRATLLHREKVWQGNEEVHP